MNKKTLTLIIFLFLVTCGLLYLALVTTPYKKPAPLAPTPTPISVNAHTMLSLSPATASQSSGQQYTLAVGITSGSNVINAVQLELAYDPQALTNVHVVPGNFFVQPNVLMNTIDVADGRISYALAEQISLPGKQGQGNLAYVSFDVQPTFTGKTTTISFMPKTAVAAERVLESVLRSATGYTLAIVKATPSGTLVPTSSRTPSAQ